MKQSIIYSFLIAVLLFACRKEDNPKIPDLTRVPTPLFTKVATTDQVISVQDPAAFRASFTVDLFFKTDAPPQKFDIVMIKNGNKGNTKTIQENVTSFPTTIEITGPQLATLFGEEIKLGDRFDIGADVTTQSGQLFQAFPLFGEGYGTGVANQPGSSTIVRYEAVCKFDATQYAGDFEVLVDEWEDYPPGTIIPVTVVSSTQLSFRYATTINAQPIIIDVDPNTNVTSAKKQAYGNYGSVDNFSAESVSDLENFVAPCEGILSIKLNHTSQRGNFGNYLIVLKKKN